MGTSLDEKWLHGSRRARGQRRGVGELAEHQVGEFPEDFSLAWVN